MVDVPQMWCGRSCLGGAVDEGDRQLFSRRDVESLCRQQAPPAVFVEAEGERTSTVVYF